MVKLPHDFTDFLRRLNSHGVEYLLMGGYAVCFHGYPRYTGDMNIWISVGETNAAKMVAVLREFGFDFPKLSKAMFLEEKRLTQLGREPVKIEILNRISGVGFAAAEARSVSCQVDELIIPVIGLSDLRANKRASAKLKDLADLDILPKPPES